MAAASCPVPSSLRDELWRTSDAAVWGLARGLFDQLLAEIAAAWNFGLPASQTATPGEQSAWFHGLQFNDLMLARACAAGDERAWEHFFALYRQPLLRAATAIAGNETRGHDLADQLYGEIYGLKERDGKRRSPLESYRGRGSLLGWLRTILAQRHVDHFRAARHEEPLDDYDAPAADPTCDPLPEELGRLRAALEEALRPLPREERFLLAAYYIDGRTLAQIGSLLAVHEATVSRKLHRALDALRKQVLRNLQTSGLSRRAAQEALGADPRDLDINLKSLLQSPSPETFPEKAAL